MLFLLCVLLFFIIITIFLTICYRNKFAEILILFFIGFLFMLFSGIINIATISIYNYSGPIEQVLLSTFLNFKIGVAGASIIHNIGIAILMCMPILSLHIVYHEKNLIKILMFIPILMIFYINLPDVSWKIYISMYTGMCKNTGNIYNFINSCNKIIFYIYLILPIVIFGVYSYKTKIYLRKKHGIVCLISMIFVYFIMYMLFIRGVFTPMMFYNLDLFKFPKNIIGQQNGSYMIILSILFMILINIILIFFFKPFEMKKKKNQKRFIKKINSVNGEMYSILHTYKNKYIYIRKMCDMMKECMNSGEYESAENLADVIRGEADKSAVEISNTLSMLGKITMEYHIFTIESCIEEAMDKLCIDKELVKLEYTEKKNVILGNKKHIVECILNLLKNSMEAMEQKMETQSLLNISIFNEWDMCCVVIEDNGSGIPKKNLRKIFRPFFTTKAKTVGNGLGLDYVKRVVNIHGGDISIKSKQGLYTRVYMSLPLYIEKNNS